MDFTNYFNFFNGFDFTILNFLHNFAANTGGISTGFMSFISLLGEKGAAVLLLGIILSIFKKTRKIGFAVIVAYAASILLNHFVLKTVFARPRPFQNSSSIYYTFWQFVGAPKETGFSFPSSHTATACAGITVLFLALNKKYSWLFFIYPLLTAVSRCYLMVHYPSDVLTSLVEGLIIGIFSYYLVKFVSSKIKFKKNGINFQHQNN